MFKSLRLRLTLIFVGLAVGPLIILAVIIGQYAFDSLEEQSLSMQHEIARRVSSEIGAYILEHTNELKTLDKVYGLGILDDEDKHSMLRTLLHSTRTYQELSVLDQSGQELLRLSLTDVVLSSDLRSWSESHEFLVPMTQGRVYYRPIRFDYNLREPLIKVSLPLFDRRQGDVVAVLVADLRFKPAWKLLAEIELPGGGDAYVVDSVGNIIAHKNPAVVLSGSKVDLQTDEGRGIGLSGTDVIFAREKLQVGDQELFIVAEQTVSQALALAINSSMFILLITVLALMVAVMLIAYAVHKIVIPIEMMAASVRDIEAGDFSLRMEDISQDEIGLLAQALNSMRTGLEKLYQGLEQEIAEHKRTTNALQDANVQLQKLDAMKSKFIEDISHELRTPITNFNIYLDLLCNGPPDKQVKYETVLREESNKMVSLLNSILDFTELENKLDSISFTRVDLNRLVEQAVVEHQYLAKTRQLELTFYPDNEISTVWGDSNLLMDVINNILLNAINYTPAGEVCISTKPDIASDHVQIVVRDTGIGLDKEELEHCFERFYRGKRIGQYNIAPGAGLGLSYVQEIIKFHKGWIEVESEVDQGSTFIVYLPAFNGN
jgi:signal transduction histidine kinase